MNDKKDKKSVSGLPIGMCLGIAIGTAIGAATNNIGLWLPVGLAMGVSLGLVFNSGSEEDEEDNTNDKQSIQH